MELNEQAKPPTDEIVDIDYMGGTFQTSKSNLQNPEAMDKLIEAYRNSDDFKEYSESVEFYQNLDKSGAPAGLRSLVDSRPNQESKLETLRLYHPTAVPFDNDNFAYIDPETKQTTIYNPEGVDWGDVAGFGREIAQFGGAVLGGLAGFVSPAIGGAYVGAAAGSTAVGALYDTYVENAGWVLSTIGGTDASQLESKMAAIKSNVLLKTMAEMRKGSSSGARLTTSELKTLQGKLGALDISDPMTLYKSLNTLRETFDRINQNQQEIYKNTYGELPIEKPSRDYGDGIGRSVSKDGVPILTIRLDGTIE